MTGLDYLVNDFEVMKEEKSIIKFAKVKEDAIIPAKESENAGYDIYANFQEDYIMIKPNETIMIPTGIASAFSSNYVMILKERGSTGTKGIGQRSGVIDSGFRGEWKVPITNHNNVNLFIVKKNVTLNCNKNDIIYPYEKAICQAILLRVPNVKIEEISYKELQSIPSNRGNGMLGSSGK